MSNSGQWIFMPVPEKTVIRVYFPMIWLQKCRMSPVIFVSDKEPVPVLFSKNLLKRIGRETGIPEYSAVSGVYNVLSGKKISFMLEINNSIIKIQR